MTPEQFIDLLIECYGPFKLDSMKKATLQYLRQEYKPQDLMVLFNHILHTYSGQFGYTPDVAIIEKSKNDFNKQADDVCNRRIGINYKKQALIEEKPSNAEMNQAQKFLKDFGDKMEQKLKEEKNDA